MPLYQFGPVTVSPPRHCRRHSTLFLFVGPIAALLQLSALLQPSVLVAAHMPLDYLQLPGVPAGANLRAARRDHDVIATGQCLAIAAWVPQFAPTVQADGSHLYAFTALYTGFCCR